jgi:hypothetical protein
MAKSATRSSQIIACGGTQVNGGRDSHFCTSSPLRNLALWRETLFRAATAFLLNNQISATLCES